MVKYFFEMYVDFLLDFTRLIFAIIFNKEESSELRIERLDEGQWVLIKKRFVGANFYWEDDPFVKKVYALNISSGRKYRAILVDDGLMHVPDIICAVIKSSLCKV